MSPAYDSEDRRLYDWFFNSGRADRHTSELVTVFGLRRAIDESISYGGIEGRGIDRLVAAASGVILPDSTTRKVQMHAWGQTSIREAPQLALTPGFPEGVTVTDKRDNPEPCGFGGVVVDAPDFTALVPPGFKVSFETLEQLADAVQRKSREP